MACKIYGLVDMSTRPVCCQPCPTAHQVRIWKAVLMSLQRLKIRFSNLHGVIPWVWRDRLTQRRDTCWMPSPGVTSWIIFIT